MLVDNATATAVLDLSPAQLIRDHAEHAPMIRALLKQGYTVRQVRRSIEVPPIK